MSQLLFFRMSIFNATAAQSKSIQFAVHSTRHRLSLQKRHCTPIEFILPYKSCTRHKTTASAIAHQDFENLQNSRKKLASDLISNLIFQSMISDPFLHHLPCPRKPPPALAHLIRISSIQDDSTQADVSHVFRSLHRDAFLQVHFKHLPDDCRNCFVFYNRNVQAFFAGLFHIIVRFGSRKIHHRIHLNEYDLFHGHCFWNHQNKAFGVLFHWKEYPKFDELHFPYDLGHHQHGSDIVPLMTHRNAIWIYANTLQKFVILDTSPNSPYRGLLFPGLQELGTIYEADLGHLSGDLYYYPLPNTKLYNLVYYNRKSNFRSFSSEMH